MKITIEGAPLPKSRHKCGCRGGRPIVYDPQIKDQMEDVRKRMLEAWNGAWESENAEIVKEASNLTKAQSFEVGYTFLFPTNKSEATSKKNAKLWGFQSHNSKPDLDNLEKLYSDCGKGIFWQDDSQISICHSKKLYSENPRTEIEIMVKEGLKLDPNVEAVFLVFDPEKLQAFQEDLYKFLENCPALYDLRGESSLFDDRDKKDNFKTLANLLTQFAGKYASDLKKIQNIKIQDSDEQEVIKAIEEGKFNI